MNDMTVKSRPLRAVKLFVTIAGLLVGGGLGAFAGAVAGNSSSPGVLLGIGLGAAGGLLAGLLWCRLILGRRALQRSRARSNIICLLGGPCAGVLVGWMATAILWFGLGVMSPLFVKPDGIPGDFLFIMVIAAIYFATPAGAVTGLVCGIVAAIAMPRRSPPQS